MLSWRGHLLLAVPCCLLLSPKISRGDWETREAYRGVNHIRKNLSHISARAGHVHHLSSTGNISILLDNLLKGYDQKLRPSFGGAPTTVEIDIEVRSMGQISEMDMSFSMDCYFRQSWVDERLAFSHLDEDFTLSLAVLDKLWKPDTFIYNGRKSYVHLITTPNKFVRLYRSGRILYSSRLTINANCPMNLYNFPMDTQRCPLKLGSFAYTTRDVVYRWNEERQVVIAPDLMLSQFDLIATPSGFENTTRRAGEFSTLLANFYLQRHMGNFLIQVYGPCILLVVLSWVSFWLNREATSDRISLGITTVLTMTFLGLEARTDLPKVSYSTALDLFVWLSYGFIFATIIEFAFVHLFTKVGSGEVYLSEACSEVGSEEDAEEEEEEEGENGDEEEPETEPIGASTTMSLADRERRNLPSSGPNGVDDSVTRARQVPHIPTLSRWGSGTPTMTTTNTSPTTVTWHPNTPEHSPSLPCVHHLSPRATTATSTWCSSLSRSWWICRPELHTAPPPPPPSSALHPPLTTTKLKPGHGRNQQEPPRPRQGPRVKQQVNRGSQMNSVSYIDEISRVLFPLSFLCINLLYWYTYLSNTTALQQFF